MIISRYLIKEIFSALFTMSFVMLLIFMSNQLIRYLKYAASGKIAANVVLQLLGLEIPYLLVLLLPLGLFLGIIFAYGRLYADNEMRVMLASGLTMKRLVSITMFCSALVALGVMALVLWVNPYLAAERNKLLKKSAATENILEMLVPGRFHVSHDDRRVVYVENIDKEHKSASNIFIAEQEKSDSELSATSWSVLSASKGYQANDPVSKDRFVVTRDGYRYEGKPGFNEYKIIQFDKYAVRLVSEMIPTHPIEESLPTKQLIAGYQDLNNAAELQWRIAMPLSALLLALLAIPLSHLHPRQSRYSHVFPAMLIYIIYINLLFVLRFRIERGMFSIYLGMWPVHALMCGVILMVYQMRAHAFSLRTFLRNLRWRTREVAQ